MLENSGCGGEQSESAVEILLSMCVAPSVPTDSNKHLSLPNF